MSPRRSPLRSRPVIALVAAEMVSSLGSQMTFLALPWFVLQATGSATQMGVVLAAQLVPIAILGVPSGTVVTRLGARRTMILSDLVRAPLLASIPLLHALDVLSFPLLVVLVAAIGVFLAPYFASQRLVLPEIVGDDEQLVAQANALLEGGQRLVALLGPVLAGLAIAAVGATPVLLLDAGSFVVSACVLALFVPARRVAAAAGEAGGVLAGLAYVAHDRLLRVLGGTAMIANGLTQMLVAGLAVLAFDEYGSSSVAGVFFASFGAGAVLGSIAAVRLTGRIEPVRLGSVAFVLLSLPIFALAFPLPVPAVCAALAASAFFGPIVNAPLIGVITLRTPEALRPKVMTAVLTAAMLAGPVALLLAGPLLEAWGPRRVFLLVAAGQLLATLPFLRIGFRHSAAATADQT